MIKTLFVSGTFDDDNGKPSKIAIEIFKALKISNYKYINGGNYQILENILNNISDYKVVFWLANVPNIKPKIVNQIKKINPHCLLVTSKRNINNKYSILDIINRSLLLKSNLTIEFSMENKLYTARIIDPLGNAFCNFTNDMSSIGKVLKKRIKELSSFTRIPSKKIVGEVELPNDKDFYNLIKEYADKFHSIIHVNKKNKRLLGNASFRCERGFPSIKDNNMIFVSQRNIDKRFINKKGFVPVKLKNGVSYFGNNKPSVDTPIQLRLYQNYPNIKYMIHSHVYIKNAPFTRLIIPCGALEEYEEIRNIIKDKQINKFSINLNGHGSLIASDSVKDLRNINYIPRNLPELHNYIKDKE